jgi:hypothetical protein
MNKCRSTIRTRKIGSNAASDKYKLLLRVEDKFMDLALFIAHTGFINVLNARKKSDADIIPIFGCLQDLQRYKQNGFPTNEVTCGLAALPLDTVWRLVNQNLVRTTDLWYIVEESIFILYIRDGMSESVFNILSDDDDEESLGSFQTTFRPEPVALSVDLFITRNMNASSMQIYRALCIMFPVFMEQHGLSRNTIVNRRSKLRRDIEQRKFPSDITVQQSIGAFTGHK